MVSFTPETVLLCLATVVVSCQVIDATIIAGKEAPQDLPVAEDRIFKGKKLLGKKKLASLFTRTAEPQVVHTLSPIDHHPIWKVHKYKGIEFRPVQVVDIPTPFDYSPAQPDYYQYGVPAVDPIRVPHTEYGVPTVDYNTFSGVAKPEIVTGDLHHVHFQAPVTTYHNGGTLRTLLGLLKSNKGLLFTRLRNLKSWKLGLKKGILSYNNAVPLPEVHEIPVKGLENLQVPELPSLGLPSYSSAVTTGPYVKVQVASPAPVYNYATPEYAPRYEYQYPPQYTPEYSVPNQYREPVRAPAPYYGAPPLFDSYGMPLPADAYTSASSDQVLSFAVPENSQQSERQDQVPEINNEDNYSVNNSTLNGAVQKPEELPKFLSEDEDKEEEESSKVIDQNNNNQQSQIIN